MSQENDGAGIPVPLNGYRRHEPGRIHFAADTESGVIALCGGVNVFVVYPEELSEYPPDAICIAVKNCTQRTA